MHPTMLVALLTFVAIGCVMAEVPYVALGVGVVAVLLMMH